MGSFISGVWGSLALSTKRSGIDALNSVGWTYLKSPASPLVYRNNRAYKVVLAHVVKREAMQMLESEVNQLYPKYRRYIENKQREAMLKQKAANTAKLIENQQSQVDDSEYGMVKIGGKSIYAMDKYGNKIKEALMLSYDTQQDVTTSFVNFTKKEVDGEMKVVSSQDSVTAKTMLFIDLAAKITSQSSKNIVMTTVQGRDYTRKELVSGGDLKFTVSGVIVNDLMDIYPQAQVRKFVQMCQYGGVINVNQMQFKSFNVDKIIILDYSFGEPQCINEQPYTFTCVAVEPDVDVVVTQDTISMLNEEIKMSPVKFNFKLLLEQKLAEIATNAATSLANAGIDALTPNI